MARNDIYAASGRPTPTPTPRGGELWKECYINSALDRACSYNRHRGIIERMLYKSV
jgi:hypothetical protein